MEGVVPYIVAFGSIVITLLILQLDPLRGIPGPFYARWTPLWMIYHSRKGDMHQKMIELHKAHGKLVRTGPNEVSISDPGAVKIIYGAGSKFRKSNWYSVWQGHRKFDLFPERNELVHRAQRRLVSGIYSMDRLKRLEPYVDKALIVLFSKLSELGAKSINMGLWAQLFAFDVIGEVTFSKLFGFMDAGRDDGSFGQIDAALRSAAWIGQVPWLYWAHDTLSPFIGNWLGIGARHGSLRAFAANEINRRKLRGSDHHDILEMLMNVNREKPDELDDTAVLSMATSNIFAGSDTTAISIGALLYYLCKNPECKEKVLKEATEMMKQSRMDDIVPLAIANKMPYLQACIYEALRCHPAVGMSLPRVVPQAGIEVDGQYIPAGTIIGTNPWVIHRNQEVFGEDADSFRPERWLESDRGQLERLFFAFGSGARVCIGRNLSWIEISKLVPSLLLRFEIELTDPEAKPRENCWWFVKQEGLHMTLKPREYAG
ncbi:cytochrome P450 [Lindgomyces ingoldianus]|uniref:Cytochrome P450 n=1 Tax=Lindgomyces ingoldianus TaxID=673940 RepID=A0ACB6R390_9PLEO|nr:cytochrome P450 [Lindgomyces ingoldianus]KAF2473714.1 cytochrome P450 [Lindgomyces ingoldianus]